MLRDVPALHHSVFADFGRKMAPCGDFWPKKLIKKSKIFKKKFNVLKIMVEQKEKWVWKALYPNKLIGY